MDVLVDDHLLLLVLLDEEPATLRRPGVGLFTTGLWYHRLCRAVGSPTLTGILSRRLGHAETAVAASAVGAVTTLPGTVGLVSMRQLAWPMARLLDDGVRLNLMSLEALAAAERIDAELCLAEGGGNPPLLSAARRRGRPTRLVES